MSQTLSGPAAALLREGLTGGGSRPAVIGRDRVVTFGGLARDIEGFASALRAAGAKPGQRLAISRVDCYDILCALLGGLEAGLTVTLLSTGLSAPRRRARWEEFRPHLEYMAAGSLRSVPRDPGPPLDRAANVVLWTSGSSGESKAVAFTFDALLWNARANAEALSIAAPDRALVLLDPSYCYALIHQIFTHLLVGGSVLSVPYPTQLASASFNARALGVTTAALVPSLLDALTANVATVSRIAGLRQLTIGGASASPALLERAARLFPDTELVVTYGLTEAGPRVTAGHRPRIGDEPNIVGRPLPGVDVSVVDDELIVRSPSNRYGVLIDGVIHDAPAEVRTGDLVTLESDSTIRWRGRKQRLINRGGLKITPAEVERALLSSPGVRAAAVVPAPHPLLGEVPKAFVVADARRPPAAADLARRCLETLGPEWVPSSISFVSTLPVVKDDWKNVRDRVTFAS